MARPFYTEAQLEAGRRQLCEAALRLYRAKGYEAVTLRSLGAEVGISSATPYRFFDSKEALFERVRTEVYAHFGEHLKAADPGGDDPLLRLRRIAMAMVDFGLRHADDYRLIFSMRQPPMAPDSQAYIVRRRTLDHVVPICQALIDAGRMNGNAREQLQVIWAALHGLISFHVSNQLIHGSSVETLVQLMLDRLLAPPTAATAASSTAAHKPAARDKRRRAVAGD